MASGGPTGQEMSRNDGGANATDHRGTLIDAKAYEMQEIEINEQNAAMAWIPGIVCLPCTLIGSWYVVQPRREAVVLHFGKVTQKISQEGCHFINCMAREIREIETSQISYDMKNQKITDTFGNPVLVSAVITYRFIDPVAALFNVHAPKQFVTTQASAVIKEVVGSFSYEQLKVETEEVSQRAVKILQDRVKVAGARIVSVNLNELNYTQEIAASMLKKQQAQALIESRELLVQGAVDISRDMVKSLVEHEVQLSEKEKSKLVTDLIIMSIGDANE